MTKAKFSAAKTPKIDREANSTLRRVIIIHIYYFCDIIILITTCDTVPIIEDNRKEEKHGGY